MTRGGARTGAGRKAIAPEERRVTICARVKLDTKRWLEVQVEEQGVTIGRIIEELVASFKESSIKDL